LQSSSIQGTKGNKNVWVTLRFKARTDTV